MQLYPRHDWKLKPQAAIALQRQLTQEVVWDRPIDLAAVRLVAGVDVSVKQQVSRAAVVVVTWPEMTVVETACHQMPTPFPYIPGLLSFREGPVLTEAFQKLQTEPDVFLFDGMGRAHPRRIGLASHLGLWLQRPTIGCGKTLLVGRYQEPPITKGGITELVDKGEVIGAVVRTRSRVKPVITSVGHLADLKTAIDLTLAAATRYRLPDPIRFAHRAAGTFNPLAEVSV